MRFEAVRRGARRNASRPAHGHQMHELGSIDVMRLDQTLGQSRRVACASSCMSMRTSLEEGIKPHRFTGIQLDAQATRRDRSEEHTSELQSRQYLVCRL